MAFNNSHLLPLAVSVGQEFANSLLNVSSLESLVGLQWDVSLGCCHLWAWLRLEVLFLRWLTPMAGKLVQTVCSSPQDDLSVLTVWHVSFNVLTLWWLVSSRGSNPTGTKTEASVSFVPCLRNLNSVVFYWSHRPALIHCGIGGRAGALHKDMHTRTWSAPEVVLQAGYHSLHLTLVISHMRKKEIAPEMCSCVFIREENLS